MNPNGCDQRSRFRVLAGDRRMTEEEEAPPGLRERHRRRTAAQLEEVALGLFLERGFEATTVDDIAAAAEVSRR
ncbi:MAG: helix-turn-helix domain-containing protein, partial [Acidimicrobiia bacterium]